MPPVPESLVERMRRDLARARRDHDGPATERAAHGPGRPGQRRGPAGAGAGARATTPAPRARAEVDRLILSRAEMEAVVAAEIADRQDTIAIYERHDRIDEAEDLRAQVAVLRAYQP